MNAPGVYLLRSPRGATYVGKSEVSVLERLSTHAFSAFKSRSAHPVGRSPLEREYAECAELGHKFPRDWSVVLLDDDPATEAEWIYALQPSLNRRKRARTPDAEVADAVLAVLGLNRNDVHAVYRRGRLSVSTHELRARIDARLLELATAGANVAQLGRVLGFHVNASGSCEALNNALVRARKERT